MGWVKVRMSEGEKNMGEQNKGRAGEGVKGNGGKKMPLGCED